jgi:hypothetical protein
MSSPNVPRRIAPVVRALAAALALALTSAPAAARDPVAARARVREVEQSAATVRHELRAARTAEDRTRARCVSEKLSEVHAQLRAARQHGALLDVPSDRERRRHRYMLDAARDQARTLARAARRCGERETSLVRVVRR